MNKKQIIDIILMLLLIVIIIFVSWSIYKVNFAPREIYEKLYVPPDRINTGN
jgi:hypothetical protein